VTECKLRIHGELSFGLAGIPYDRQSGYDVEAITRSVFSAPGDFRQHVEVLKGRLLQALRWEIRQLKDKDPQMYRWAIRRGEEPLMLALAVVERRIPRLAVLGYQLDWNTEPPGVNVRENHCPGDCHDGSHAYYLGEVAAIDALIAAGAKVQFSDLPDLVQLEIRDKPAHVGPPISILEITPDRRHWGASEKLCSSQR
jgi:hypothetical protein